MTLAALTAFAPILAAVVGGLVSVGTAIYNFFKTRRALEATPEMRINEQAKTDNQIFNEAEAAVTASDKGDLAAERQGDAE